MEKLMKALVLEAKNTVRLKDVPIPAFAPNEMLIRTKAATICTSDMIDKNENPFDIALPVVMGHEGAGVVAAIGEAVTGFRVGDAITAHPVMPCGKCPSCLRGLAHLCDDMAHLGLNRSGVFAEYFVTRPDRARIKPPAMSFSAASLMEPVCVCLEALKRAAVNEGGNVLILGDGPFGVMMTRLCVHKKPKRLILTGRHDYRLAQAGCAQTINEKRSANIVNDIMRLTNGEGIDAAILCVNNPAAVDTAIEVLRSRGTLAIFSGISGKTPIDLFRVHVKELTLAGACNDDDFLDEAVRLLHEPALDIGGLVTHEIPFADWEKAFYLAENGKDSALKVSMVFDEGDA